MSRRPWNPLGTWYLSRRLHRRADPLAVAEKLAVGDEQPVVFCILVLPSGTRFLITGRDHGRAACAVNGGPAPFAAASPGRLAAPVLPFPCGDSALLLPSPSMLAS